MSRHRTYEAVYGLELKKAHRKTRAAIALYELWRPSTVIDLGCGIGSWLMGWWQCGCEIAGIEPELTVARRFMPPIISDRVQPVGLDTPNKYERIYELVTCLEVVEHIPAEFAGIAIENICRAALDRVLFSAAHPGQRGFGHVNCRQKEDWIAMFANQGFGYSYVDTVDMLRVIRQCRVKTLSENGMVFRRRDGRVREGVGENTANHVETGV